MSAPLAADTRARPRVSSSRSLRSDVILVVLAALALRLVFLGLTSDTYDYDEFVLLTLARDFTGGAVPYSSFMFFHPPGMLVLLRAIEPLTSSWWPTARLLMLAIDVCSAVLVWLIATHLWDRRTALAAGLLYAASPLALVGAVRVGQDSLITVLGLAGLLLLVRPGGRRPAILAGLILASAIWVKYPALYFLPIYLLAAPRRCLWTGTGLIGGAAVLFLPFAPHLSSLYRETVTFQRTRWSMALNVRLETTFIWWLAVSPFALPGLVWFARSRGVAGGISKRSGRGRLPPRPPSPFPATASSITPDLVPARDDRDGSTGDNVSATHPRHARITRGRARREPAPTEPTAEAGVASHRWPATRACAVPLWLVVGFLLGGLFILTSQVYYHYFAVVVPFGALAGAPVAVRLFGSRPRLAAGLALAVTLTWGAFVAWGGSSPLFVTAAHLSDLQPTVRALDRLTAPGQPVLADQSEYGYLARRPDLDHYFWNVGVLVGARYLERRLPERGAVVLSYGASSGFPAGFTDYLDAHFRRIDLAQTSVWVIRSRR